MAKVFLDVDETSVNIANDGDEVFGQTGDENVIIMPGVTGVVLDGNVEGVTFDGDLADYLFQQQGNQLLVYSGAVLVATIPVQVDEDGTQLTFDNGTFTAEFGEGAVLNIDGEDVPTEEPGPVTPPIGDTFTLAEALAAEELPEEYFIVDEAGNLFDNGAFAEGAEDILDGAAGIEVTDAITVAQYDLLDGLATFDMAGLTYDAADTFANLFANPDVVAGAGSYELTDAEGTDFGRISEEEIAFIEGAANFEEGYWEYTVAVEGETFTLTAEADTFVGTVNDDTFQGTFANISDDDTLIDQTTTDNDILNLMTVTANYTLTKMPNISGIENIVFNTEMSGGFTVDTSKMSGVKNLTVNRGDLADGLISGKGAVTVNPVDASKVAKVTAGSQVDAFTVTQATKAGIEVDAAGVTGNVTVTGAATIAANDSTGTVSITAGLGNATEDKKAVTIDAAKAATVTTAAAMTGSIAINAAAATTVTVNESKGGVTIDAQAAKATITATGVTKEGADITAGTGTAADVVTINATGTAATDDVATVSAAGVVTLDATATDILNLSGNGADVTYALTATTLTKLETSGDHDVNLATGADSLDDVTISGVNNLKTDAAATGAVDMSKIDAAKIIFEADHAGKNITVSDGANIAVTVNQTGLNVGAAVEGDSFTIAAAKFGTGAGAQTRTFGAIDLTIGEKFGTANLMATEAAFTATSIDAGADTTLNITGDKAVNLGGTAVVAKSVAASTATGVVTLTMSEDSKTVATGSGNDVITINDTTGAAVMNLNAGDGNNTVNVTKLGDGSTIVAGSGDDTFNVAAGSTGSFVIQGGAGNDTYDLADAADVVIADSAGTDKIVLSSTAAYDFTANDNFAFSGIEELDITAANNDVDMTGTQVSGKTFKLTGDAAADALVVSGKDGVADTIDLSGITINGTATLQIVGTTGADSLTGSAKSATEFVYSAVTQIVAGETIVGGEGTDIISFTGAAAFDLSVASITSVETVNTNTQNMTFGQGTGIVTIDEYADGTANSVVLTSDTTAFGAMAGSAAAVDTAGEWFFAPEIGGSDSALTYFDEVLGVAQTVTLLGTAAVTNDDTAGVIAGNIVISIA
jgi:hypothetical protein